MYSHVEVGVILVMEVQRVALVLGVVGEAVVEGFADDVVCEMGVVDGFADEEVD